MKKLSVKELTDGAFKTLQGDFLVPLEGEEADILYDNLWQLYQEMVDSVYERGYDDEI